MSWNDVGNWLKNNATAGASLVGSLLIGNVQGAVAAGVALVSSATGTTDPEQALLSLQNDPTTMIRLRELAIQEEASIREHIREVTALELADKQSEHTTQQHTIQVGDTAEDEYVRRTRPKMARQSYIALIAYCAGCFLFYAHSDKNLFDLALAGLLSSPALGYIGMRTGDKFSEVFRSNKA